ncbi:MAG: DUF4266 domain-containing protein [Gammaproteobacteria bacterium]
MIFRFATLLVVMILLNACTVETVQPWDRDLLAQKKMQLDSHPLDSFLDDHINYSKESSSGGSGVGGGGCGCN